MMYLVPAKARRRSLGCCAAPTIGSCLGCPHRLSGMRRRRLGSAAETGTGVARLFESTAAGIRSFFQPAQPAPSGGGGSVVPVLLIGGAAAVGLWLVMRKGGRRRRRR